MVVLETVPLVRTGVPTRRHTDIGFRHARARLGGPQRGRGAKPEGEVVRRQLLPGIADRGEAAGFEPLELLGDGCFDERAEITVGDPRAHEGSQPFELLVECCAGRELHAVTAGTERSDDRRPKGGGVRCGREVGRRMAGRRRAGRDRRSRTTGDALRRLPASPCPSRCTDVTVLPIPDGVDDRVDGADAGAGLDSGSLRIRDGTSLRGASSAISSSIWRLGRCVARRRRVSRFSAVRCGASRAIPLR